MKNKVIALKSKQIYFRPFRPEALEKRVQHSPFPEEVNNYVNIVLDFHEEIIQYTIRTLRGRFERNEILALFDILNSFFYQGFSPGFLAQEVEDAIRLDGLDEKWGTPDLLKKVQAFSPTEEHALTWFIKSSWNNKDKNDKIDSAVDWLAKLS